MASQAELDDIEFDRIHTVQQQVRDAVDLGHAVFYLHVLLLPPVLSAMHQALAEHGFRIQSAQGWSAPDGPGQRFRIVKREPAAEDLPAIDVAAAKHLLRTYRTCLRCVGGDSTNVHCQETATRNAVLSGGELTRCGRWAPDSAALEIHALARKLMRHYIIENQAASATPEIPQ